jgi:glycosyltransferase involved in cell wall biosynthesis
MQNLSYRLTKEVQKRVAARVISWGGSQKWLPFFTTWAFVRALAFSMRTKITLIHLSDPVLAPLGIMLRMLLHVPLVVNAHGLDVTYPNALYQAIIPSCLRRFERIICISDYTRRECIRRGVDPERCVVIPPGIEVSDYTIYSLDSDRRIHLKSLGINQCDLRVLLSVGRLVPRKGIGDFISEALPLLAAQRRDWIYLIVGEGPERSNIEAAIRSHGLTEHVKLLGRLDHAMLLGVYSLADLFVMPNVPVSGDPEGFGLVILEARSAGVPVVAADLEGISEALGDENEDGILVKPRHWADFVAAINFWLDRENTIEDRLQRRSRVEAQFAWAHIAEKYLELFHEVAEDRYV